jgi:hypothetical protein
MPAPLQFKRQGNQWVNVTIGADVREDNPQNQVRRSGNGTLR